LANNGINIVLPKLYPWQKAVTDTICGKPGSGLKVVVKAPRQRGKSFVSQGVLCHYALSYPNTVSAIVEPTNAQARKVFRSIKNGLWESGVIKKANETFLEIEFINDSRIMFKSAESGDNLRGYTVSGILVLDEAAFVSQEILELVLPWLNVHNAPMLIVSTPKIRDGVFYNYWKEGIENTKNVVSIDWTEWDTSELLSADMMEQYRRTLTANQFRSEILGEWLDDVGLVFSYLRENTIQDTPGKYVKTFLGIDFGAGDNNDYTSLSAFNEQGQMVFLDYFNNLSTLQQIERLTNDIMSFGNSIVSINAENNSIGKPLIDLIIQSLNQNKQQVTVSKINRWVTTNASKGELVNDFQIALEQGDVKIFDNKMLLTQFSAYEAEYNPKTQVITYNGAYGTHDDLVMSTMLAYNAYKKQAATGNYSIGFTRY
jgi:hypothetical protein